MDETRIQAEEAEYEVWELAEGEGQAQDELTRRRESKALASGLDLIGRLMARPYTPELDRTVRGVLAGLR